MMEIKDQEITLDDLYSLNLSKLDEWKCIIPVCYFFSSWLAFYLYMHMFYTIGINHEQWYVAADSKNAIVV